METTTVRKMVTISDQARTLRAHCEMIIANSTEKNWDMLEEDFVNALQGAYDAGRDFEKAIQDKRRIG